MTKLPPTSQMKASGRQTYLSPRTQANKWTLTNQRFTTDCPQCGHPEFKNAAKCTNGVCGWLLHCKRFLCCDHPSVQSCVRPVYVAIATGLDEFRKQGSYRVNDLKGRDIRRSVLAFG